MPSARPVCIIKLGALGDVIMATALVDAIRRHHRGPVHLVTVPAFAGLFAAWEGIAVDPFPRRGPGAMWALVRWLRAQRFQRLYDLQSSDRTAWLCALSGAAERVGNHPRWPYTHHPPERWRGQCHIFERMNAVLASAGVPPAAARPLLPLAAAGRERVAAWLRARRLQAGRFVVMHAGASATRPEKRWPHFGTLAASLAARGLPTVWVGAAEDAAVNAALARRCGIDATGQFSIPELAELGRHAAFAVTNDSAPMHALSAAGVPVFGLFGPSDWRRNHALGQAHNVLHAPRLADLSPERVMARLEAAGVIERQR